MIGLAVAVIALLVAARVDGGPRLTKAPRGASIHAWSTSLPPGWHALHRHLTGVLIPVQVFAAATYPIRLRHRPGQCGPPRSVLARMPAAGVLLQVIEYPPRDLVGRPLRIPRLPLRPDRFAWSDATWAPFECAGPSFKFDYRQAGHAFQAQAWMNRATVDPVLRAGALKILDDLRPPPVSSAN